MLVIMRRINYSSKRNREGKTNKELYLEAKSKGSRVVTRPSVENKGKDFETLSGGITRNVMCLRL